MLAAGRELSRWRVTMCCPGAWVRFQRRKVAYRVAAVLALLLHDHAQAKADRACFLRVPGRGQPRAYPFQVVVGEPVDDAAYHPHAGAAYFQHLCQRRARAGVDAAGATRLCLADEAAAAIVAIPDTPELQRAGADDAAAADAHDQARTDAFKPKILALTRGLAGAPPPDFANASFAELFAWSLAQQPAE